MGVQKSGLRMEQLSSQMLPFYNDCLEVYLPTKILQSSPVSALIWVEEANRRCCRLPSCCIGISHSESILAGGHSLSSWVTASLNACNWRSELYSSARKPLRFLPTIGDVHAGHKASLASASCRPVPTSPGAFAAVSQMCRRPRILGLRFSLYRRSILDHR